MTYLTKAYGKQCIMTYICLSQCTKKFSDKELSGQGGTILTPYLSRNVA